MSQRLMPTGQRSGLHSRTATTKSVAQKKNASVMRIRPRSGAMKGYPFPRSIPLAAQFAPQHSHCQQGRTEQR